jgi:F-type H+-transporting ATPase subunit a
MEEIMTQSEIPNLVTILTEKFSGSHVAQILQQWENIIFSLVIASIIILITSVGTRKRQIIPGRLQGACEIVMGGIDSFVCGILGAKGRKYTPFIGTLFIYILFMNLFGLIPLMKSPTSSLSTTFALAICVFIYVQFTAIKEMGFLGYLDHLSGKPRGIIAYTVFMPIMMFFMHIVSQLIRPISLSLRLRSNILGDDMLLSVLSSLGISWIPLLIFSSLLVILAAIMQAIIFSLLTTIYFALALEQE